LPLPVHESKSGYIIGRQQESISRIERGMSLEGPKLPTLTAIADACGMRLVVGGSPSAIANEIDRGGAWSVIPSFGSTAHEEESERPAVDAEMTETSHPAEPLRAADPVTARRGAREEVAPTFHASVKWFEVAGAFRDFGVTAQDEVTPGTVAIDRGNLPYLGSISISNEHAEIAIATQLSGSKRKTRAQSVRVKRKADPLTVKAADD
ncbi:MAG: hypothetical protein ACC631_11930, partial [Halocynthiibacter sp.]